MKEQLKADLTKLAAKILEQYDTSPIEDLREDARVLYEKLVIAAHLAAASESASTPTAKTSKALAPLIVPDVETLEKNKRKPENDVLALNEIETKPEFVIDEINASITDDLFVPAEKTPTSEHSQKSQMTFDTSSAQTEYMKNDMEQVGTGSNVASSTSKRPTSLNDRLKKNLNIGLNDRLAFIKNLFDGNTSDYNRVISQLNTSPDYQTALTFIEEQVKPDHKQWEGKEEFEKRFLQMIQTKFEIL